MKSSTQANNDGQKRRRAASVPFDLPITGASLCDHQICKVVQKHRRLRPIAPAAVSGPNSARTDVTQPNWTAATQAVFAAWLPSSSKAGAVVASAGKTGTRASQTARTSLGRRSRKSGRLGRAQTSKIYCIRLLPLPGSGKCIISYRRALADHGQLQNNHDRSMV
jgi:hypothetical protein